MVIQSFVPQPPKHAKGDASRYSTCTYQWFLLTLFKEEDPSEIPVELDIVAMGRDIIDEHHF